MRRMVQKLAGGMSLFFILCFLLVMLVLIYPGNAYSGQWVSIGPEGGHITALAIDPSNTSTIYAGTRGGSVSKSENGGSTWTDTNVGLTGAFVQALAIDPSNTSIIYAGSYGGVFKSENGGKSWTAMNSGLPNGFSGKSVFALAIDPINTSIIYVGIYGGGVYKSTTGGNTWAPMNTGLTNNAVYTLAIDPVNTSIIYAGIIGGGVYKSATGGNSWTPMNTGLTNNAVYTLAIDPANTSIIYAGTYEGGAYKSTNGGNTWTPINEGLTSNTSIYAFTIDPANTSIIYAGIIGGVYKSTTGGNSWIPTDTGLTENTEVHALAMDPANTSIVYSGTYGGGILKSSNGGSTWATANTGLSHTDIYSVAIDPTDRSVIYAGVYEGGVFKSTNGGNNWIPINTGLTNNAVNALAIDPSNRSTIYAGICLGGVYKSTNGGNTWTIIGLSAYDVHSLAIDPANTSTIYAGQGGVYKSNNGGSAWLTETTEFSAFALAINPANTLTIYAGSYGAGVHKSTDGGSSWAELNTGLTNVDVWALAIDPINTLNIYAGYMAFFSDTDKGGVLKSSNGGNTWTKVNTGLPISSVDALAIDPVNTSIIYAGTGSGVFRSTNGGNSWDAMNTGLPDNADVNALTIDPSDTSIIYAGTWEGGVFKYYSNGFTISKSGTGSGSVTTDSGTINWIGNDGAVSCGAGTSVTITAAADIGSTFGGWVGCDSVIGNQCSVTINSAKNVTAIFTLTQYSLTINKDGNGSGIVGEGGTYDYGTTHQVNATAASGSIFTGWSGDCSGSTSPFDVTMLDRDMACTATFTLKFTDNGQTITDMTTGLEWPKDAGTPTYGSCAGGTLIWDDAFSYVSCLNANNYLGHNDWRFPNITELISEYRVYIDDPGSFSTYSDWLNSLGFSNLQSEGDWSSTSFPSSAVDTGGPMGFYMFYGYVGFGYKSDSYYVWPVRGGESGTFGTLSIQKAGKGNGTVKSSPPGISCGTDCSDSYSGIEVALIAMPDTGSAFLDWSGDADCSDGTVTMTDNKNCTATFTLNQYALTVNKIGAGSGTVGGGGTYDYGTSHDITATAAGGSTFTGWSGDCSGTNSSLSVFIDTTKNCIATFVPDVPNPPVVAATTPTNNTKPTWTWSTGGSGNGTFRHRLDNPVLTTGATTTTLKSYTPATALATGSHTLYVQEKNALGLWSSTGSKTISIETTKPINGTVTATAGAGNIKLNWSGFSDGPTGSGIANYKVVYTIGTAPASCSAGTSVYTGTDTTYTHTGLSNLTYGYRVCAIDKAGNMSTGATKSAKPLPTETTPPSGSIVINSGAQWTKSATVVLTLTATDDSQPIQMCISNTTSCTTWTAFAATKPWTLTSGNGTKKVNAWFRDAWGNTTPIASPYSDTIGLDATAPTNGTVTATPGSGQIALSWSNFSDGLTGSGITSYKIVYAAGIAPTSCSTGTVLSGYDGVSTGYTHTGLSNTVTYGYRVCAIDKAGNMSAGTTKSAKPL